MNSPEVAKIFRLLDNGIKAPKYDVAVAGSFALFCYIKYGLKKAISWVPNDCDVYVTSPTRQGFEAIVNAFVAYARRAIVVNSAPPYRTNGYAFTPQPIYMRDVNCCGATNDCIHVPDETCPRCIKLSFIHTGAYSDIPDLIKGFDIDICQIAFFFKDRRFYAEHKTLLAIQDGKATVAQDFIWESHAPTDYERTVLASTLRRMTKYHERGFAFTNMPIPKSVEDGEVQMMTGVQAAADLENYYRKKGLLE